MPVKYYSDDTSIIFHDTSLFSLLILLVHISKFNVHDTLMILPQRLANLVVCTWRSGGLRGDWRDKWLFKVLNHLLHHGVEILPSTTLGSRHSEAVAYKLPRRPRSLTQHSHVTARSGLTRSHCFPSQSGASRYPPVYRHLPGHAPPLAESR